MHKFIALLAAVLSSLLLTTKANATPVVLSVTSVLHTTGADQPGLNGATLTFNFTSHQVNYSVQTFGVYDFFTDDFTPTQVNCIAFDTYTLTIAGSTAGNDGVYTLSPVTALYLMPNFTSVCLPMFPANQSAPDNLGVPSASFSLYSYPSGPASVANPALGAVIQASDFSPTGWTMDLASFSTGIIGGTTYSAASLMTVTVPEPATYGVTMAGLVGCVVLARRRQQCA